jgi:ornithine decarboxylase
MSENKVLDHALLQKYDVKPYGSDYTIYDIINDFLTENQSEKAFYIIDLAEITHAYNRWMSLLGRIECHYAVKCNGDPVLLEVLSDLSCKFDCASQNEIKMIMDITNDPSRIIFANPVKFPSQIQYARANDVDLMTFDCVEEIYKVRLYHPYCKLVLRIAVDDSKSLCKFNKKFGCKLENVEDILKMSKMLNIDVIGFSFHVGSSCSAPEKFYEAISDCKKACEIAKKNNINISLIDIGGGFSADDKKIKFEDVAENINKAIDDFFKEEVENGKIKFISEPGRYFAEKSHTLVLSVIGKKTEIDENGDKHIIYYLNDSIYGSFNCKIFDHKEIIIIPFNERNEQKKFKSTLWGPTCDSVDLILENVMLPELVVGERLFCPDFGAYTVSAASGFNGFKTTINKYIYRS